MATEGGHGSQTSGEYIQHHLQNLQICKLENGEWAWNQCGNPMAINVDSMFWSVLLGLILLFCLEMQPKASPKNPPNSKRLLK